MAKIVTMGEIMLRLSPEGNFRFVQTDKFNIIPGGGEANVAISCANYGHDSYFVSKLPKHEIGQIAVNALRRYGVNTDFVARGGDRIGLYYAETGASMRPSKVIYDRAHSAIAEAKPEDFDFDKVFEGADWFHWSGITPAISDASAECLRQACIAAKKHGVTISCDLNFRKKLWTSEKAISIMRPLMQYVDVCIGNEEDAELDTKASLRPWQRNLDSNMWSARSARASAPLTTDGRRSSTTEKSSTSPNATKSTRSSTVWVEATPSLEVSSMDCSPSRPRARRSSSPWLLQHSNTPSLATSTSSVLMRWKHSQVATPTDVFNDKNI